MTTDPTTPEARALGVCGLKVGAVGLGCMGMSQHYGPADEGESIRTIHRAIDQGGTMLDTAISYGAGHNESLIGRAIKGRRGEVTLATKFGIVRSPGGRISVDGRPSSARECCSRSHQRNSPWPGCLHKATMWCRSPAPSTPAAQPKTPPRSTSRSPPRKLNSWKRSSRAEPGAANEKRSPHTTTPRNAEAPERREYFTCRHRPASPVVIMSRSP
jgi:hypothetical protein